MPSRLIVIEGIDQSGKATQAKLLARRLAWNGRKVKIISYPIYTSFSGHEISSFLERRRSYSPEAVHMLYSLNRWETLGKLARLLETSDYLIVDRYSPSNIAYGVARGLEEKWLSNLDRGLPEPDMVILIDTPIRASFARKTRGRDRNEKNRLFLTNVKRVYRKLARERGWKIVDGSGSPEAVGEEIWEIVKK